MKYTVKSGQDILDVCVQKFGDVETGLFKMFEDNTTLNLNSNLVSGQEITLNNENLGIIKVKTFFENLKFNVNNADELQLSINVGGFDSGFSNGFNNQTL